MHGAFSAFVQLTVARSKFAQFRSLSDRFRPMVSRPNDSQGAGHGAPLPDR